MRRTVTILTSLLVLLVNTAYAQNPTDVKNLPPHKQAELGPAEHDIVIVPGSVEQEPNKQAELGPEGHDIVPGFIEQEPINDVIHSATPRELQPQENTLKTQRFTGLAAPAAPAGNDITKENLKTLLQRYETKNPPLNQEELMRVENFIIQSQEQEKNTIGANHSTVGYHHSSREATDLFFSEYAEGSSSNKYLEIYNGTGADVDLSSYVIMQNANGGPWDEYVDVLSGTLANGDVYVIANSSASADILAEADLTGSGICYFNGDDARALIKVSGTDTTILDYIGTFPDDPGDGWDVAGVTDATKDYTLVRKSSVTSGNTSWTAAAGTNTSDSEWSVEDRPTAGYTPATLGSHTMTEPTTGMSEGFEGTFPPYGWEAISNNTSNSVSQSSTIAHGGTYSARFSSYSSAADYNQYLITPLLTVSSGDSIVFWHNTYYSSTETFYVGVSTTDSDVASFTFGTANYSDNASTWTRYAQDISSYAGQNVFVAIKYASNYMYYFYVDDFNGPPIWVDTNPVATLSESSIDFGNVNTASSSSNTVVLTNSGGGALTGTITSDATEFTVGTATIDVAVGASDTITITYTPSAESTQSGNIIFTHNGTSSPDTVAVSGTGMAELLVEGFEGSWPPSGWTDATATNYGWAQNIYGGAHSGSYWAYCNLAGSELVTPSLTIPAASNYRLRFWYRNESSNYAQSMDVTVGSDTLLQIVNNATNVYQEEVISLAAYAGQTIQVSFIGQTGGGSWDYGINLDDVKVEVIPPQPTLTLNYSEVSFYPNTIGTTVSSAAFTVGANSGAGALVVDSITTSNSEYSASLSGTASDTVLAGGDLDLDLSWTPSSFGLTSADVIIHHNAATSPDTFSLSGEAGYQYVNFNDQSFPNGWELVDMDTAYTGYYETNYGAAWSFYYYAGPGYNDGGYYARSYFDNSGSDDWMITSKLAVASGDSVIFRSSSSSSTIFTDTLHVYVSTTDNELASFTTEIGEIISQGYTSIRSAFDLSAYAGTEVYVAIVHHGSVGTNYFSYRKVDDILLPAKWINPNAEALLSTSTLDFGGIYANNVMTESFTITNNGSPDLAITGFTSDNAAVTVSPTTATLAYDESATFTVTLTATVVSDTGSATLTITSNDATNPTLAVSWITAEHDLGNFSLSTGIGGAISSVLADVVDTIAVSGASGMLQSAQVYINLDHTWMSDVELTLIAPNGESVFFFGDNGGSGDNMNSVVLDGGAAATTAPFWPDADTDLSLDDFVSSMTPNGNWILSVNDDAGGDDGTLNTWGINLITGPSGHVAGTITDSENGMAIDSVMVSVGTLSSYSGSDGSYIAEALASGDHATVTFVKDGYTSASFNVIFTAGDTLSLDLALIAGDGTTEVYSTGFESGDDMGWTVTAGTNPFERSAGFTFYENVTDSATVAPFAGDSMMVCSPTGYANDEYSWWRNLATSNMDLSDFSAATFKINMNYWTEADYDFVVLMATMPDIYGTTYYYLDVNGDGFANEADRISGASDGWVEVTADLSPWTGTDYGVEIAVLLWADATVDTGFGVAIDDITVTGYDEPRPWVADLTAESFVNDQIHLMWSDPTGGQRTMTTNTITMNRTPIEVNPRNPRKAFEYETGEEEITINIPEGYSRDLVSYNVYRTEDYYFATYDGFDLIANTAIDSYTDTNVENHKLYYYYVTAVYDEGESLGSWWAAAGAGEVTDAAMADIAIDFEDSTFGNWEVLTVTDNGWDIGPGGPGYYDPPTHPDGGLSAFINDYAAGVGVSSVSRLVSPFFNLGDAEHAAVTFDYYNGYQSHLLNVWAWIGWDTWLPIGALPYNRLEGWQTVSIDLADLAGMEHVRLYAYYTDNNYDYASSVAIDNVSVSTWDGPTNLTLTETIESVTLSWNELNGQAGGPNNQPTYEEKMLNYQMFLAEQDRFANNNQDANTSSRQGGDTFADATVIDALPYMNTGTTAGYANDYNMDTTGVSGDLLCDWTGYYSSASTGAAADVVYSLTLSEETEVVASLCGSGYDTAIGIFDASDGTMVLGDDDECGLQSEVQCTLPAGTYYIVVDGYSLSEGDYSLNVYVQEDPPDLPNVAYNVYREGDLIAAGLDTNVYLDETATLLEACYQVTASVRTLGVNGDTLSYVETGYSNEACGAVINQPPGDFNLLNPTDGDTLMITGDNIGTEQMFAWNASVDPNGTPVEYEVCTTIQSPFDQFCDDNGTAVAQFVSLADMADYIDSLMQAGLSNGSVDFTWTVYATDGMAETEASNGPFALHVDAGWALGVNDELGIPDVFALHQNYPNPFNPVTNIRFDVPEESHVQLDIYNVTGQKVATLVNGNMRPGFHSIRWNGTNENGKQLASGMYIYRISSSKFTDVKKLILMK